jgi:hypothetical protein
MMLYRNVAPCRPQSLAALNEDLNYSRYVASRGSEFLGKWVNRQNPNDMFQVLRNGEEYLIVGQNQKPGVGAIYKDRALEIKGALLSANLTYVKQSDTILMPGFSAKLS